MEKFEMFDLSYFIGNSYFDNDGSQNHLIFQPMIEYFKTTTNLSTFLEWKP